MSEIFKIILDSLGGISFVLVGLFAYLGKLRLERYKRELNDTQIKLSALVDRTNYVSKAQFDKEFGIYQEAWKSVAELKSATLTLRDSVGEMIAEITGQEIDKSVSIGQILRFEAALNDLSTCLKENKPFYCKKVHDSLNIIVGHCFAHFELAKNENMDDDQKQDFINTRKEIVDEINNCCDLIRERIESYMVGN